MFVCVCGGGDPTEFCGATAASHGARVNVCVRVCVHVCLYKSVHMCACMWVYVCVFV